MTKTTPTQEDFMRQWGSNLAARMYELHMTDGQLAAAASTLMGLEEPMTTGAIANYRNAFRCPGPAVQAAIAAALGVRGRDLFPLDLEEAQ
jgi:hypothetical protein